MQMTAGAPWTVLDTNVVLDWLIFSDPHACAVGRHIAAGALHWVRTAAMEAELMRVLGYPALLQRNVDAAQVLKAVAAWSHTLPVPATLPVAQRLPCTDADDQGFLDLAMAHRVPWLLSRDKAVLRLARRAQPWGVSVLTPQRWVSLQPPEAAVLCAA
jgi:predicted nucleic acid-binding protein